MLLKCPECELQVSDKAANCPHCGYPLNPIAGTLKPIKSNKRKRKRLPNGFGQISEVKDQRLRKPFRAMICTGKTPTGRYIVRPLKPESYFATYNDAYAALLEYNRNPYDLEADITVAELYERWTNVYFENLKSDSSCRTITNAWKYCSTLYNMRVKDLRARHIKGCMEEGTASVRGELRRASPGVQGRIKSLFNLMLDYALEYELVDRNYARTFDISDDIIEEQEKARRGHLPFTEEEMEQLWAHADDRKDYVDVVLIQCYSGWRPQELGLIELKNVDLTNWTFTGGMKTDAGRERMVPIHPRIRELVARRYKEAQNAGSPYLISCPDGRTHCSSKLFTYDKYQTRFTKIRDSLNLNPQHRPHDGRMHFITLAKKYKVDEYAIKYMVGHQITDITEKVYTRRDPTWLMDEICKIR